VSCIAEIPLISSHTPSFESVKLLVSSFCIHAKNVGFDCQTVVRENTYGDEIPDDLTRKYSRLQRCEQDKGAPELSWATALHSLVRNYLLNVFNRDTPYKSLFRTYMSALFKSTHALSKSTQKQQPIKVLKNNQLRF
jgi:hypothetical protein